MNEVTGIVDNFIDAKVEKQLRQRLSPDRFKLAIEKLVAYGQTQLNGNTIGEFILEPLEKFMGQHEDEFAAVLSDTVLTLLLGDQEDGVRATTVEGEQRREARGIVRIRLINHLRRKKGCSRSQAREAVDKLTHEQIDMAMGQLPVAGAGDWLASIWQYIRENWPSILAALLPILLMLL